MPFIIDKKNTDPYLNTSTSWKRKTKTEKLPKPHAAKYNGKIYLLIDGYTYSTGAALARYLKEYGKAMVFGEEGGTRYEGFVAGSQQIINLPNTKIRIGIPRYHKAFPDSKLQTTKNRGLLPDIAFQPSISDLKEGKDSLMELVISTLSSK